MQMTFVGKFLFVAELKFVLGPYIVFLPLILSKTSEKETQKSKGAVEIC